MANRGSWYYTLCESLDKLCDALLRCDKRRILLGIFVSTVALFLGFESLQSANENRFFPPNSQRTQELVMDPLILWCQLYCMIQKNNLGKNNLKWCLLSHISRVQYRKNGVSWVTSQECSTLWWGKSRQQESKANGQMTSTIRKQWMHACLLEMYSNACHLFMCGHTWDKMERNVLYNHTCYWY